MKIKLIIAPGLLIEVQMNRKTIDAARKEFFLSSIRCKILTADLMAEDSACPRQTSNRIWPSDECARSTKEKDARKKKKKK